MNTIRQLSLGDLFLFTFRIRFLALVICEPGRGILEDLFLRETASGKKCNGGAFTGWVIGVCVERGEFRFGALNQGTVGIFCVLYRL